MTGFKLAKKFREKFYLSPGKFGKFLLEFQICLYILYSFTSPSAENREKFVHFGRLFLPSRPVGYSLHDPSCYVGHNEWHLTTTQIAA